MGVYVNPGNRGFEQMRKDIYIDKTGLVAQLNRTIATKRKLTCVSRPRRFGKSYSAQMLCAYYDTSCDSHHLFDDLEIAKDESYEKHLNQYNVIYLDMANMIGKVGAKKTLIFLQEEVRTEILEMCPTLKNVRAFDDMLLKAAEQTGRYFVMLIDEWDALIREAPEMQKEYLTFLRTLFKGSNTTDKIFAGAYMTGILPIKKEGSQSAVSEFKEFTMLWQGKFGRYVGFTEEEVKKLCEENDGDFEKMKHWYDGYQMENVGSVYNPYSVMEAIKNERFTSYWKKTSAAESLLTYIDMDEEGLQKDIADLISGKMIEVNTNGFSNDFQTFRDKHDVLTLLIHLGYLSYIEEEDDDGVGLARIPNEEVRKEFKEMLRKGTHPELIKIVQTSDQLLKDTIAGNEQAVAEAVKRVRETNYAPNFYNDEQALRYSIKMAYISSVDQYAKIEELPTGHGLADVVFVPKRNSRLPAMVVELKWSKDADSAIRQIKEKNYPEALKNFSREILLVGINFDEKTNEHTCKIEKI